MTGVRWNTHVKRDNDKHEYILRSRARRSSNHMLEGIVKRIVEMCLTCQVMLQNTSTLHSATTWYKRCEHCLTGGGRREEEEKTMISKTYQ